jgi:Kef-type K+ transport system membrane component KefB
LTLPFPIPPLSTDLLYLAILFALFVVPKVMQRFRLPGAVSSVLMGVLAGWFGLFKNDPTIGLLGTFGIVALFLFAGLEIDAADLHQGATILTQHLVIQAVTLVVIAYVVARSFHLGVQASVLVGLALLTPSCGFILDSLDGFNLGERGRFWTKSKAIAAEIVALGTLFVALQSSSLTRLALASLAMGLLIFLIPFLFRLFAARIAPFAPRSEFAFLLMIAALCAQVTQKLGVYYLVGAFLVGVAAQRFRERLPAMSSEKMLHAVEAFASLFVPFYFFSAGLHIRPSDLGLPALGLGLVFLVVGCPLRVVQVVLHQRWARGEDYHKAYKIGVALLPTLVFSLVLAEILRERFGVPQALFGGIIVYTIVNTVLPGFLLHTPPPEYDAPHLIDTHPDTPGT